MHPNKVNNMALILSTTNTNKQNCVSDIQLNDQVDHNENKAYLDKCH